MNTKALRQKILDLAIHGKLVNYELGNRNETLDDRRETLALQGAEGDLPRHCEERSDEAILYNCHADSELLRNSSAVGEPVETTRHCEKRSDEAISYNSHADSELLRNSSAVGEPVETTRHCEERSDEAISSVPEEEQPFELPRGWKWCRLGDVGTWQAGTTPSKRIPEYYIDGIIPWLNTGDLNNGLIKIIPNKISKTAFEKTGLKLNPAGSVCIAMYGATIGKLGILTFPTTTNQACCVCSDFKGIENKYLFYFLMHHKNIFMQQSFGGAQPNISKEKIVSTLIPLPPLAEQKQIVAKIEQIFSQIDILEQNKSTLLLSVKQAKRKILDLAIHGKLVDSGKLTVDSAVAEPTNAVVRSVETTRHCEKRSDEAIPYNCHADSELLRNSSAVGEPVETTRHCEKRSDEAILYNCHADSELLRNSSAVGEPVETTRHCEKQSDEAISSVPEEEQPFELPQGWKWCRLGDVGTYKKGPFGSSLKKSMFVSKGTNTIKVYEQKNAIKKDFSLGDYYITKEYFEAAMKGFEVFPGDIIVSCAGTIGETYVMPDNMEKGIINQALMKMNINKKVLDTSYFLYYFDYTLKEQSEKNGKGTAIKNIPPFSVFKQFFIPLPPLAEQKQIVAKIEQMFSALDKIQAAAE